MTSPRGHDLGGLSKVRRQERINGGWQSKNVIIFESKKLIIK